MVDGQRMHFTDTAYNAPALIFSHGLLMDGEMFEPQVTHFGERFRCVTWVAGAGHAPNLTHPDPVNAAMDAFYERHPPT